MRINRECLQKVNFPPYETAKTVSTNSLNGIQTCDNQSFINVTSNLVVFELSNFQENTLSHALSLVNSQISGSVT
jgi:hypothetical protein